ncbi:oxygenase MpaB family protein [Parasphingorhabdus pacifica]
MTHTDDHTSTTDTGLYGPDSITWRIHIDPSMWIGAFSALALQSLHPHSMWGTYQNSALLKRKEALARLFRTADFVSTRTFGSLDEVDRVGHRVRRIHSVLTGTDEDDGSSFRIDEEENLRWVHCAEIYPYLLVARAAGVPLTNTDADTYVNEQRRSAAVVGLDPERVPGSVAELENYFERMRPELRMTESARSGSKMWANTPAPIRLSALRIAYPYLAGLGVALLPGWARTHFGLPATGRRARALETTSTGLARITRRGMKVLPDKYIGTAEQTRRIRYAKELMRATGNA